MDRKQQITDGIRQMVSGDLATFPAKVRSVDLNNATCEIETNEGLIYYDVRLRAAIDGSATGAVLFPAPGSWVIVGRIGKSNQLYVQMPAALSHLTIQTEKESLKIILSDLIDAINQITVQTGTGPSSTPINATDLSAIKDRLNDIFKE